jgi:hypothetical protein
MKKIISGRWLSGILCLLPAIAYAIDCKCVGNQPGDCCSGSGSACDRLVYSPPPPMCGNKPTGGSSCSPVYDEYGNQVQVRVRYLFYSGGTCSSSSCATTNTGCIVDKLVDSNGVTNTLKCMGGTSSGNYFGPINFSALKVTGTCP